MGWRTGVRVGGSEVAGVRAAEVGAKASVDVWGKFTTVFLGCDGRKIKNGWWKCASCECCGRYEEDEGTEPPSRDVWEEQGHERGSQQWLAMNTAGPRCSYGLRLAAKEGSQANKCK